jgi:MFS family permease
VPALTGRLRTHTYGEVLRTPGAWKFYLAAAPARIGLAMTGLGIVWLVHGSTGSYAAAGTVTGAYAIAEGLAGPQVARLIDRFGQTRMLPITLLAHAIAVAVLIASTIANAPLWLLVVGGVLAGGSLPQLGAQVAARWSYVLRGTSLLPSAFALEALGIGLAFLIGPLLVGTIGSLSSPVAGSILATSLALAGGAFLAVQRRTAPPPTAREQRESARRLITKRFLALSGTSVGIGLFFGSMQVSVTAFAVGRGTPELAGPLYSITSLVGLFAGLAYGARRWRTPPQSQLVIVLAGLTLATLPLLIANSPLTAAFALALPGLAIAPFQTLSSVIAESSVRPAVLTQAFTWLNSGNAAGIALGAAISGHLVDAYDPKYGYLVALSATLLATAMAVVVSTGRRKLRPDGVDVA